MKAHHYGHCTPSTNQYEKLSSSRAKLAPAVEHNPTSRSWFGVQKNIKLSKCDGKYSSSQANTYTLFEYGQSGPELYLTNEIPKFSSSRAKPPTRMQQV